MGHASGQWCSLQFLLLFDPVSSVKESSDGEESEDEQDAYYEPCDGTAAQSAAVASRRRLSD